MMKCETQGNHSFLPDKFYQSLVLLLLTTILAIPQIGKAQMFSVGEDRPRLDTPTTSIYVGLQPMNVTYKGSNPEMFNRGLFEFEGPVIRFSYDNPMLDLFLGAGGSITGINEVSYFDFGGNINAAIPLHHTKVLQIDIPIRITSRYVTMTNSEVSSTRYNRFNFGSLAAGAGGRVLVRPLKDFRIKLEAVPQYGFAFASGGFFGGSQGSIAAQGHLYFDHLFGDLGLSVGYKYDMRNYDIDEEVSDGDEDVYDYEIKGHIVEIGISF